MRGAARLAIPALLGTALLALLACARPTPAQPPVPVREPGWRETLEAVARAVVVLRVSVPRAFDTDHPATETATGFVVDAERGLILTNRHVVKPGPVVAEAVFLDHEEVEVAPVYRDPVHDFGFYRYDPQAVRFMESGELELRPDHARVGTEVRIVGNDAGEKLSILAGTLARLDRSAPGYGRGHYNDFNTFYVQAASGTSGGSSGSPVVDIHGHAVALNAGASRRAASSYYLPLDRVTRALALVREGSYVPRGTLQTVFRHRPYDELRRLGLGKETEARVRERFPRGTGLLVVDEVVPGGPADGMLRSGDVLVRAGGELLASFTPLESLLDAQVGGSVALEVERGGEPRSLAIPVQDLHAITPAAFLEFGGAVIHPLSYQQARAHAVPVRGLFLASAGYAFGRAGLPRGALLTAIDGEPVETLSGLEAVLAELPQGARVRVRHRDLETPRHETVSLVTVDRRWFPMRGCARDDATGRWPCAESPPPPPPPERPAPATTSFPGNGDRAARRLAASLAMVDFDAPYRIDGLHGDRFQGAGLVVDAERGLVLVDRETVPIAAGDLRLVFAGSVEVPGEVVALHPTHGFAVVRYDPAHLGDTPVRTAELRTDPLAAGASVRLVGLSGRHSLVSLRTEVARVEAPTLPLPDPPRFRESNLELALLADATPTVGGVLADDAGRVRALWAALSAHGGSQPRSFFAGIGAETLRRFVEPLRAGRPVAFRELGAELRPISLAEARGRGLSDARARALERHDPVRRQALAVQRLVAGTDAASRLREGDLLLEVDGRPVTAFAEVERAAQAESVALGVLREGREETLRVATELRSGRGTDRFLLWGGAVLQRPPRAVAAQRGIPARGVYVSWFWYGSPAGAHGLRATRWITEVDGRPTPDLDAFLAAVSGRGDREAVRLRTRDLEGREEVITLKLDLAYWPTVEFARGPGGWVRRPL